MIKLAIVNISGQPNGILDLKKRYVKSLKKYTKCKQGFAEDCLELYESHTDRLSNNLKLNEIFILNFFQFHCKINRNQSEIVVEKILMVYTLIYTSKY